MKEPRFKIWSPELTLDLKEIMLNAEWYYKVEHPKRTDLFLTTLYTFALVWLIYFIYHSYILISNFL